MAHDVFISHSTKDKTTADAVCAMLESDGVRCWIAPRDVTPGLEWGESIIDAIKECRVMVLVFTTHSNESPQIRREVERAVNHGVVIVPLRVEDVIPNSGLEYFIGNVHWLDAMTPPLEDHVKSLAGTVKILLARMKSRNAAGSTVPVRLTDAVPAKPEVADPAPPASAKPSLPEDPPKWQPAAKEASFQTPPPVQQVPPRQPPFESASTAAAPIYRGTSTPSDSSAASPILGTPAASVRTVPSRWRSRTTLLLIAGGVVAAIIVLSVIFWPSSGSSDSGSVQGPDPSSQPSVPAPPPALPSPPLVPSPWALVNEVNGVPPFVLDYRYLNDGDTHWIQFRQGANSCAAVPITYSIIFGGADDPAVGGTISLQPNTETSQIGYTTHSPAPSIQRVDVTWGKCAS
jgi:hypothetical protein